MLMKVEFIYSYCPKRKHIAREDAAGFFLHKEMVIFPYARFIMNVSFDLLVCVWGWPLLKRSYLKH